MKQISILGCGWLGLPLAKSLITKGIPVKGSTTSLNKISLLQKYGIQPFVINLSESNIEGDTKSFLEKSDLLIINIPPKIREGGKENFVGKIQQLIPIIEKANLKKVLLVSSISVYSDDNSIVTEVTIPQPKTESGKQLVTVEKLLQDNKNFNTTVIRFGGLVGDDRHPIYSLAGRKELENPDAPINLIHLKDCIGIIESIINNDSFGDVFNAVTPFHPSRIDYYTQKAVELLLPIPEFNLEKKSIGKTILSVKIETVLGYSFQNKTL